MLRDPKLPKLCIGCKHCPDDKNPVRKDYKGWCDRGSKGVYLDSKGCLKGELAEIEAS